METEIQRREPRIIGYSRAEVSPTAVLTFDEMPIAKQEEWKHGKQQT